jgi:hypothetical protein
MRKAYGEMHQTESGRRLSRTIIQASNGIKSHKKAQMWSMDFVISVMMFFLSVVLILFAWNYSAAENYEQMIFNEMQTTGLIVSDVLIRTGGSPPGWNITAMAIGLASEENSIDDARLRNFLLYMDYNNSRSIMGMRNYEYYFSMKDIDDQLLYLDGFPIEKGYQPYDVRMVVPTQRYVIFRGNIAKMNFIIWF